MNSSTTPEHGGGDVRLTPSLAFAVTPASLAAVGAETSSFDESVECELRPDAATEPLLRNLLAGLQDLGYLLNPPGGQRRGYLNVTPVGQRGRVLSVNTATGRAQFETNSWDRIGHTDNRFVHLDGHNRAAHPLESEADVRAILEAARIELGFRGGRRRK